MNFSTFEDSRILLVSCVKILTLFKNLASQLENQIEEKRLLYSILKDLPKYTEETNLIEVTKRLDELELFLRNCRVCYIQPKAAEEKPAVLVKKKHRIAALLVPAEPTIKPLVTSSLDDLLIVKQGDFYVLKKTSFDDQQSNEPRNFSRKSKNLVTKRRSSLLEDIKEWDREYPNVDKSKLSRLVEEDEEIQRSIEDNGEDSKNEFKNWFLGFDFDENELVFDKLGRVKAGTLEMFVKYALRHDRIDLEFEDELKKTYSLFCTAEELGRLVLAQFDTKPPSILTSEEKNIWIKRKGFLIKLKVINSLRITMSSCKNEQVKQMLRDFCSYHIQNESDPVIKAQLQSLLAILNTEQSDQKSITSSNSRSSPKIIQTQLKKYKFIEISPYEMARQLTLKDFEFFSMISSSEFLKLNWSKHREEANNLISFISRTNAITNWAIGLIVREIDLRKRAVIVKNLIQLAEELLAIKNFNSLMAILAAFRSAPVHRLKRTFELVPSRNSSSLQEMTILMSSADNFSSYRQQIASICSSCIPFLGLCLTDLTFIHEGNPDFLEQNGKKLINFAKHRQTAAVIRMIEKFQAFEYEFLAEEGASNFLEAQIQKSIDRKDDLYSFSLLIEPKDE